MARPIVPVKDRFMSKVRKDPGGCWTWIAVRTRRGYGKFYMGGRMIAAHRVSYGLFNGQLSPRTVVMHSCDNPSCVNPDHLSVGSFAENATDMARKNRGKKSRSGLPFGVVEDKRWGLKKRYWAQIRVGGKSHFLGMYATQEEAHSVAVSKKNEMYRLMVPPIPLPETKP